MHKTVLIIGKVWPEPNSSAAGTRMMQIIQFFKERGDDVTFATHANPTEFQEDLSALDVKTSAIALNDRSFDEMVTQLRPEIVVFDRFMTEEQFGWRVTEACPEALRVLDTEDLHFLREARHEGVKKEQKVDLPSYRSELQFRELAAILRSDLSLMVSDVEMEILQTHYSAPKEKLLHLPFYVHPLQVSIPTFENRKDFAFIGNYRHAPNVDAVRYLKSTLWKEIRKKLPGTKLNIYGAYCAEKVLQLSNVKEGFIVHGLAKNASEVVSSARVSLAPLRFGAGIKGKLLESINCGTPFVTSSIGAEGIISDERWIKCIEDDPKKFVEKAVQLYQNEEHWNASQQLGFETVRAKFDKKTFTECFQRALESIPNLDEHRNSSLISAMLQHQSHQASRYMSMWIEEKKRNGRGGS